MPHIFTPSRHLPATVLRVHRDDSRQWRWLIERSGEVEQCSPTSYRGAEEAHEQGSAAFKELEQALAN